MSQLLIFDRSQSKVTAIKNPAGDSFHYGLKLCPGGEDARHDNGPRLWLRSKDYLSVVDVDNKVAYKILKSPIELSGMTSEYFMDVTVKAGVIEIYAIEYVLKKYSAVKSFRFSEDSLQKVITAYSTS